MIRHATQDGTTVARTIIARRRDQFSDSRRSLANDTTSMERAILRGELDQLAQDLPALALVYVIERPEPDWTGERGFITRHLLRRHLPAPELAQMNYMVCGPDAMLDAVHRELLTMGVPRHRQHSERFNMV